MDAPQGRAAAVDGLRYVGLQSKEGQRFQIEAFCNRQAVVCILESTLAGTCIDDHPKRSLHGRGVQRRTDARRHVRWPETPDIALEECRARCELARSDPKLDVEGSEIRALTGAKELIQTMKPWVFLEWYEPNFRCFGHQAQDLLDVALEMRYQLVALPDLVEIRSQVLLTLHVQSTASFALLPC